MFLSFLSLSFLLLIPAEPPSQLGEVVRKLAELDKKFSQEEDRLHELEMRVINRRIAEYRSAGNEDKAKQWEDLRKTFEANYAKSLERRKQREAGNYEEFIDVEIRRVIRRIASLKAMGKPAGHIEHVFDLLLRLKLYYIAKGLIPHMLSARILR